MVSLLFAACRCVQTRLVYRYPNGFTVPRHRGKPWSCAQSRSGYVRLAMEGAMAGLIGRIAEEAVLNRISGSLRARAIAKLAQDVADMAFGGLLGDHQRIGDRAIAVAARNQGDHIALARGQAMGIDECAALGDWRWFVHCCADHTQKLLAQFVVGDRGG